MTKPTVAGNAYRWAHPAVEQMVRCRPSAALDFLRAGSTTKHFVALAIRGWEAHQDRSEQVLRQLSGDIFTCPRPIVLAELWGGEFGSLSFSKPAPWPHFAASPVRSPGCGPARPATPGPPAPVFKDLAKGNRAHRAFRAAGARSGVASDSLKNWWELFDYVMRAVHRHRPDLDDIGLATALRELGRADHLSVWLRKVLRHAELAPSPWDGTETIAPLRTVAEIHATGVELRNCLLGDDRVLSAVLGQCCYYRVSGRHGPAVVSVTFDALLGAWRIESYRGPANALLKPAAERHILEAFAAAGIRFFGDYPRERALDGWDD